MPSKQPSNPPQPDISRIIEDDIEEIVVRVIKTYDATAFDTWGKPIDWKEAVQKLVTLVEREKMKGALTSIKQYIDACENAHETPSHDNLSAFYAGQLQAFKELTQ